MKTKKKNNTHRGNKNKKKEKKDSICQANQFDILNGLKRGILNKIFQNTNSVSQLTADNSTSLRFDKIELRIVNRSKTGRAQSSLQINLYKIVFTDEEPKLKQIKMFLKFRFTGISCFESKSKTVKDGSRSIRAMNEL